MGRRYTVTFSGTSVVSAQDLFYLAAGSYSIALRTVAFGCVGSGQSAVELLPMSIKRFTGGITAGNSGAAITPVRVDHTDTAASYTARVNDTVRATTTSAVGVLAADAFNIVNGYYNQFEPLSAPRAPQNGALIVGLDVNPVGTRLMSGYVIVEEMT